MWDGSVQPCSTAAANKRGSLLTFDVGRSCEFKCSQDQQVESRSPASPSVVLAPILKKRSSVDSPTILEVPAEFRCVEPPAIAPNAPPLVVCCTSVTLYQCYLSSRERGARALIICADTANVCLCFLRKNCFVHHKDTDRDLHYLQAHSSLYNRETCSAGDGRPCKTTPLTVSCGICELPNRDYLRKLIRSCLD